jgi:beta-glucosidase
MGIREGKAYSAMCAYNRFQGKACCGSNRLLIEILRNEWGFNGYVVSDCGAINDIYENHKIVESPEEAAALAVKSGCDLECGQVYESLKNGSQRINYRTGNRCSQRLFTARFKLGMLIRRKW